ncbi:MAG TPA: phospholipid carrier-dependent glycosyltransferase [Steroidobacteraceae bacterium]|jgi:4-amino-4-deoxy-L-arabinose transferase-like glycosyltransferase
MANVEIRRVGRTTWLVLALIIVGACALSASTWHAYSHTWDEPEHLAAGLQLLDRGRYEYDTQHPPFARILIALGPYLAGARSYGTPPPVGVQEGIDILYNTGHYDLYLTLARLGALPFLALLLWSTWLWARRLARTQWEALLAVALVASTPPVLGHAALATLDVAAAGTTLLALYTLQSWMSSRRRRDAISFGMASGIAIGTKLSAIPYIGCGLVALLIVRATLEPRETTGVNSAWAWRVQTATLVLVATIVPILFVYGGSIGLIGAPRDSSWIFGEIFRVHFSASGLWSSVISHVRLPGGLWGLARSVASLEGHNDAGHPSFLLGSTRSMGWWYFYLVALAAKTPLPLLGVGTVGMIAAARDGWRERNVWLVAPAALFVAVLSFASAYSHINIGIRHVLVLYPFMALGAAYVTARVMGAAFAAGGWRKGLLVSLTSGLLLWQAWPLWADHPDYLPYFNEAIAHPRQVLVDSDLDWGQDLRRLEQRLAALKVPEVALAYMGTADLAREALPPWRQLAPNCPTTGWIAITALAREHALQGYSWLDAYQPRERVGKTTDLYFIPAVAGGEAAQCHG